MPGTGFLHGPQCASGDPGEDRTSGADAYCTPLVPHQVLPVLTKGALPGSHPFAQLTMDGLLDVLIERAGLNVMSRLEDRRWATVRDRLAQAASLLRPQGEPTPLPPSWFIPQAFQKDQASELEHAAVSALAGGALVVAPLKEVLQGPYGWRLTLRHLPHLHFWLSTERATALEERAGGSLVLSAPPASALALLVVHPGNRALSYVVTACAIRRTHRLHLPSLSDAEDRAMDSLISEGAAFLRPLRFDAPWSRLLASVVLLDGAGQQTRLGFVDAPTGCSTLDSARKRHLGLLARHDVPAWLWRDGAWS
jgi:hypothetical protein